MTFSTEFHDAMLKHQAKIRLRKQRIEDGEILYFKAEPLDRALLEELARKGLELAKEKDA